MGILVRSDIPVLPSQLQVLPGSLLEIQNITVHVSSLTLSIINIYNPSGATSYEDFNHYFSQIHGSTIIVGDFNAHHPLWSLPLKLPNTAGRAIAQILQVHNNICLATQPGFITYSHPTTGLPSVLDLCFSTADLISDVSISRGPCLGSDHYPILVQLNRSVNTTPIKFRKRYKLGNVNWNLWQSGLTEISWNDKLSIDDANLHFIQQVKSSEYLLSESSGIYKPKYHKPWWTSQCGQLVAERRRARRIFCKHPTAENLQLLRIAENNAKKAITEAKKQSWQTYASTLNSSTPISQIWNKIKSLRNTYKPTKIVLEHKGNLSTDSHECAELFADHFQSKFESKERNETHNNMVLLVQSAILSDQPHAYNENFTVQELNQALQALKNTSPGHDRVENLFLKHLPPSYIIYLLSLYNFSFQIETLPLSWKQALLTPILKPGKDALNVTSYRPISMLSCIGKVMERLVNNRLDWILERSLLLNHSQSGFRKKRSTYDQLTCLENEIRLALQRKLHCLVIFLDLEGAFDAVDHTSVLYKLNKLGIEGRMLGWLNSFLMDRSFCVTLGGIESVSHPIRAGVPQGSILSPLLFNVLLHDIPHDPSISISLFADDIAIYATGDDIAALASLLQNYLDQIQDWMKRWYQKINASKSKSMYFSYSTITPPPLYIQNIPLDYVSQYKFLGLYFDSPKLTWSHHLNYIKQRTSTDIALLKSISHNQWGGDRSTLLMFYTSVIRSKLDYASYLYNTAIQKLTSPLEVLQNQCIRICTGLRHTTPIVSLLAEAHIPSLKLRRTFLSLKYYGGILEQPCTSPVVKQLKRNSPATYPGFFNTVQCIINQWKIPLPSPNHCMARSPFPPWYSPDTNIYDDFVSNRVEFLSSDQTHHLFNDLSEHRFPSMCHIYTDGSKSQNQTTSAFVIPSLTVQEFYPLPKHCSVLTTELYAIYRAAKFAYSHPQYQPYVLFTDSLSAVHLLLNNNPVTYRFLVYYIQSLLYYMGNSFYIQWIPGHKGIEGNEWADTLAKSDLALPIILVPVPYEDYVGEALNHFYGVWKQQWIKEVEDSRKGLALFNIRSDLKYWPWSSHKRRIVETGVARLRVGHAGLAQYMFRFGMALTPLCSCGALETVTHFLLFCPNYARQRNILSHSLQLLNITTPLDLQLLLGGSPLPSSQQFQILEALSVFLDSTKRLTSL